MASEKMEKPHAICIPCPAQGHIIPMMHLAKLLHSRGFHITFVHTEFSHLRLIRTGAIDPAIEIEGFCFEAIPDGLPVPEDANVAPDPTESTSAISKHGLAELIRRINGDTQGGPPVSCMMRDAFVSVAQPIGDEFGIPDVAFWPMCGGSFMGFFHIDELIQRGYLFKDANCSTNGYLDTHIDWIPAMPDIRLKDLPTMIRTVDPNDFLLDVCRQAVQTSLKASAIILNTFEELDNEIIDAAKHKFKLQRTYAIGPLFALCNQIPNPKLNSIKSNLWKEETEFIKWLDKRGDGTVVYVNFGSVTIVTPEQLKEFAWGLANSNHPFMWIIRPNLVSGGSAILDPEFLEETKGRGVIASWCAQKQVLDHPSVGGFLTHNGWNSTLESIHSGVPMLCWPFFADQQMNCRYACTVWGNGMEIDGDVKREKVEGVIKELMEGEKGKEMRKNAMKWKKKARKAVEVGGSSYISFDTLVNDLLVMKR
ncbi:7-deoxyloganetin glucosyltransferase-like isoform X2 [Magnolia sinica]|uniref:7-deoxyloganetin glucosyltransferase-like isoform X2 n=1 Tax=Magnolia sinica TaxID=86752 RepID=UPI002658A0D3|nr:7-deoxyloganetin glucosyltransferase-like isoform X2 [Magnolia sinica]